MKKHIYDKTLGCLVTAGMGDAVGAPSEGLSRLEVIDEYGGPIREFVDGSQNLYAFGNHIGEVTDDASQMYEMAKAVIASNGNLTLAEAANAIIRWSVTYPKYYPRNAGPTTSTLIDDLVAGKDPVELGKMGKIYGKGTSNGAAMRIASAGLCNYGDWDKAIETAVIMTKVSHGTQHAYSGACAIACGIAEGMTKNSDLLKILKACIYGAEKGEEIGRKEARIASGPKVVEKIVLAIEMGMRSHSMEHAMTLIEDYVGNNGSIQESVGAAIGLFTAAQGDPIETILGGANIGGDTDTIACIGGSLAGAYSGFAKLPQNWYNIFKSANPMLDFEAVSKELTHITFKRI